MKTVLQARRIARRFFPSLLYFYTAGKLVLDSAYAKVERALHGSDRPLLDIGCGVGLLPAYLRANGHTAPIRAFDTDESKIERARTSAESGVEYFTGDAGALPEHCGDVVMLDVLHYFDETQRRTLLEGIAERVAPGGVALIRNAIHQRNWRFALTLAEEWLIGVTRWIPSYGWQFPKEAEICAPFIEAGFSVRIVPMKGPFNSYFFEFKREA